MEKNPIISKTVKFLETQFKKNLRPSSPFHLTIPIYKKLSGPKKKLKEPELILELGGSFLKMFLIDPKEKILKSDQLDFYHPIVYTPALLNKQIFHHLQQFLPKNLLETLPRIYFIFAYPLKHFWRTSPGKIKVLDGTCLKFSKTHKSKGIIGSKIGLNLENYLKKHLKRPIEVITVNDSLPTVFSNLNSASDTLNLGIIVGTGTNCGVAYIKGKELHFTNTEFGTYQIPSWSEIDATLLKQTGPDYQTEKMISGNWQHLLFKIALPTIGIQVNKFASMDSGQLESFFQKLKPKSETDSIARELWYSLSERSANILALAISVLAKNFSQRKLNLTLTGKVFENSRDYQQNFLKELKTLLPKKIIKAKLIIEPAPTGVKLLSSHLPTNADSRLPQSP